MMAPIRTPPKLESGFPFWAADVPFGISVDAARAAAPLMNARRDTFRWWCCIACSFLSWTCPTQGKDPTHLAMLYQRSTLLGCVVTCSYFAVIVIMLASMPLAVAVSRSASGLLPDLTTARPSP